MAGEPLTHDTLERMTRDKRHPEALAQSRARPSTIANNRIQLTKSKMNTRHTNTAHHDPAILSRKEANNALNLIDRSLENMPPVRRRTVQLEEMLAPQRPADMSGHSNNIAGNEGYGYSNRKRYAMDVDNHAHLTETRLREPINAHPSNDSSWELRQCQDELRQAREQALVYKEQLAEKTLQYEELFTVRITEPEKALQNFQHSMQNTEEAYLELRNQFEIILNRRKEAEGGDNEHQEQAETASLRDLVRQLETELEQKNAEMNGRDEFYTDLTGLVVRDKKTKNGVTSYKCVITGENGALQFALSIGTGTNAYVFYSPVLERHQNSKLIQSFPTFLKEDIEFPKDNLRSFFSTLFQLMNR